jgi:hypothetical protein
LCRITKIDKFLVIFETNGDFWPHGKKVPKRWSMAAALIARVTYCRRGPDGNGYQCGRYNACLSVIEEKKGKIFNNFFLTKKSCYMEPSEDL